MLKKLLMGATLIAASASVIATPSYTGDKDGNPGFNLSSGSTSLAAGYYVWQDIADPLSWTIAWTSDGADHDPVSWFGDISIVNSSLQSTSTIQFENTGTYADNLDVDYDAGSDDEIEWSAYTNDSGGYDGFSFTLGSNTELLLFSLGSSMNQDLDLFRDAGTDIGVAATEITIGDQGSSPNVWVEQYGDSGIVQRFEVSVPEPASIALLGLGLAGLGFARRKAK